MDDWSNKLNFKEGVTFLKGNKNKKYGQGISWKIREYRVKSREIPEVWQNI